MARGPRKRKASALDDDVNPVKPKEIDGLSPVKPEEIDGPLPVRSGRTSPAADRNISEDQSQDTFSEPYGVAEVPFTIQCPARPSKRKSKVADDVTAPRDEDGGHSNLNISYTIRPGSLWEKMKRFRHFIVGEQKFSLGSIVYINRHTPTPPPPPPNASEAAVLEYDRANLWVAKVLEVRARDAQNVYIRVFWLYWPDELPMGRQPYHGASEFIQSNAMDIVDAMTVAGHAEVKEWEEQNDEQEDLGQRFFRQFFDIKKFGLKGEALSEIRRHCTCHGYYNPDKVMYKCPHDGCGTWNHEECLVDATLQTTYKKLVEDSGPAANGTDTTSHSTVKTLFPAEKLKDLKKSQNSSTPTKPDITTPKSTSKAKKKTGNKGAWEGKFSANITQGDDKSVKATITDERGQDPETWTEDVQCLKCGKRLD